MCTRLPAADILLLWLKLPRALRTGAYPDRGKEGDRNVAYDRAGILIRHSRRTIVSAIRSGWLQIVCRDAWPPTYDGHDLRSG